MAGGKIGILRGHEEEVVSLFKSGLSAATVAARFSHRLNVLVSRQVVIGIVHRAGASRSPSELAHAKKIYRQIRDTSAGKKAPQLPHRPKIIENEPEAIGPEKDFPDGKACKYIKEAIDSKNWRCCGQPIQNPKEDWPWCDWHWHNVVKGAGNAA